MYESLVASDVWDMTARGFKCSICWRCAYSASDDRWLRPGTCGVQSALVVASGNSTSRQLPDWSAARPGSFVSGHRSGHTSGPSEGEICMDSYLNMLWIWSIYCWILIV